MKFHYEIYLPAHVERFARRGIISLIYSGHALQQAKYKNVPMFYYIDTNAAQVIEVEFIGGKYHKTLYRINGNGLDVCLAVMYNGTVKTTWINKTSDKHSTLRRDEYVQSDSDRR